MVETQGHDESTKKTVSEITRILEDGLAGPETTAALLPLVYDELRRLAAYRLAQERPGQTLQATALVHEAYLRLVKNPEAHWENKRHFFVAAAEAMRRILIENARRKSCQKRGGEWHRTEMEVSEVGVSNPSDEVLEIHEVLDQLVEVDPDSAELVKLRFFAGLTQKQAAEILGLSKHAAEESWTFARAWLFRAIHTQPPAWTISRIYIEKPGEKRRLNRLKPGRKQSAQRMKLNRMDPDTKAQWARNAKKGG